MATVALKILCKWARLGLNLTGSREKPIIAEMLEVVNIPSRTQHTWVTLYLSISVCFRHLQTTLLLS